MESSVVVFFSIFLYFLGVVSFFFWRERGEGRGTDIYGQNLKHFLLILKGTTVEITRKVLRAKGMGLY